MIVIGSIIFLLISALSLIVAMTILAEVIASITFRSKRVEVISDFPPFSVLVPAHNEAKMIGATLLSLSREIRPDDQIIVVADNCDDDTAEIARSLGVKVIERSDLVHRGKGFALDHGIKHLRLAGLPVVVVFLDADCRVLKGSILDLARFAYSSQRPAQCNYLLTANESGSLAGRLSALAIRLKNLVRPLGCLHMGIACPITGSGFAIPSNVLNRIQLGSDNIVEDLALGIDLAIAGAPTQFFPDVTVTSTLPSSSDSHAVQRRRWEQGYLTAMVDYVPRITRAAIRDRDWRLGALALDTSVPPLAFLCLLMFGAFGVETLWLLTVGSVLPVALVLLSFVALGAAVLLTWWCHGRDLISGLDLLYIPIYILRKIPMYLSIALGQRIGWVRTSRE